MTLHFFPAEDPRQTVYRAQRKAWTDALRLSLKPEETQEAAPPPEAAMPDENGVP